LLLLLDGPVWLDPVNDLSFVESLKQHVLTKDPQKQVDTTKRILAFLENMLFEGELQNSPYSFSISKLSKFIRSTCPRSLQV